MRDGFAPPGPTLLPLENRMGRGQDTYTGRTSQLLDRIGPVGQFGENIIYFLVLAQAMENKHCTHNCFRPPFLFVKCLLSTGPTPSSWQGCSLGFPLGFALGKSFGAALPALGKPRPSLLFYLD